MTDDSFRAYLETLDQARRTKTAADAQVARDDANARRAAQDRQRSS
jgi:hypothetical protein